MRRKFIGGPNDGHSYEVPDNLDDVQVYAPGATITSGILGPAAPEPPRQNYHRVGETFVFTGETKS